MITKKVDYLRSDEGVISPYDADTLSCATEKRLHQLIRIKESIRVKSELALNPFMILFSKGTSFRMSFLVGNREDIDLKQFH